jgi:hypothetical protein
MYEDSGRPCAPAGRAGPPGRAGHRRRTRSREENPGLSARAGGMLSIRASVPGLPATSVPVESLELTH